MSALPFTRPEPPPAEPRVRYEARRKVVAVFTPRGAAEVDLGQLIVEARLRRTDVFELVKRYAKQKGVSLSSVGWGKGAGMRDLDEDGKPES